MAQNFNKDLVNAFIEAGKIQSADNIPQMFAEKIVPTIDVTPNSNQKTTFVKRGSATSSGNTTVFTSSSTKTTYITGLYLHYMTDATNDGLFAALTTTINGQATQLLEFRKLTTTAYLRSQYISFEKPLKIDKGVSFLLQDSYTAGTATKIGIVYGYELD